MTNVSIKGALRADTAKMTFDPDKGASFKLDKQPHHVPGGVEEITIADAGCRGLRLRIRKDRDGERGARTYAYRGRVKGGSPITVTIGDAATWSLAEARVRAEDIRKDCQAGINPNEALRAQRNAEKAAAQMAVTFETIADDYFAHYITGSLPHQRKKPRPRSIESEKLDIARANMVVGNVLVQDITAKHGLLLTTGARKMAQKNSRVSAEAVKRAFNVGRRILNHAVTTGLIETNPLLLVVAPVGSAERDRYLSPDEVRTIWETCDRLGRPFDRVLQFLIAMPVRRSIALNLRWADIDADNKVLRVRADVEGNKSAFEWKLPLNDIAISILGAPSHPNDPVFEGHRGGTVSLTSSKVVLDRETGIADWQLHDIRRTVSTLTADALPDADEDALDMWLMHKRAGIKGRYQKAPRVSAMRKAAQDWNAVLSGIIGNQNVTDNVVAIGGAA